jgi:aspartate aminotransferase
MKMAPPDPILGTTIAYRNDKDSKKMNLGVGAYRDDDEKPYVFKVVRRVEQELAFNMKLDKEYSPIDGVPGFNKLSRDLIFGDSAANKAGRIITA